MAKAKTTSNDALIANKVDEATINAFDLSPHLIRLMWDEPFFATILRIIKKRCEECAKKEECGLGSTQTKC